MIKDSTGVKHNYFEDKLKSRIKNNEATQEDKLRYAKLRYKKLRSSRPLKLRLNPIRQVKDRTMMNEKRISRIVSGRGTSHRDKLVSSHAENLASQIKAKAEANKESKQD